MLWKSKLPLLSFCLSLMCLTIFSTGGTVKADETSTDGFVIEADRVVGTGMTASLIKQETSTDNGKVMLRFQYKSAMIYGMKLTKQVNSPKGPVSISLKANGPVSVKNMIVDTTAISFKGACVKAAETIPELGMEDVVMVAHSMESENSIIKQLVLNTVSGQSNAPKLGKLKIIQDLSMLPVSELDKELDKIKNGHFSLTCVDGSNESDTPVGVGKITEPIQDAVDVVTNPLKPITQPLKPILDPLDPVTKPLEPVLEDLDPVTKPLEPVLENLDPVTKPLKPVLEHLDPVTKPLKPVIKKIDPVLIGTTEKVEQVVKSVCSQLEDAKGVVTKELALSLIDEAINKNKTLSTVCQGEPLKDELQNLEEGLLKSLNLIGILGKVVPVDSLDQLNKMREQIAKEKDGAIIYSP
ncbi:hypothetical protein [Neobacillus drentensis]|uniref:hypothetical protein n=1 Tax=Neobacillus drentensis TaxID=220684 RepID=UPI002FFDA37F